MRLGRFSGNMLTEAKIRELLLARHPEPIAQPPLSSYQKAAVLIPMLVIEDQWHLLFIRRTDHVQNHKGQVAFPGGMAEPEDPDPESTALREAAEEIGLLAEDVTLLGRLGDFPTISHFLITPVVGRIRWPIRLMLSASEVSRAFTIPLAWLADRTHWDERPYQRSDGWVESVIFFEPYQNELLWGITARITIELLKALKIIE